MSGITPALSPETRALALEMAEAARAAGVPVATDLNYRARLWTPAEAAPVLERLARAAEIVIATADDLRALFGMSASRSAGRRGPRALRLPDARPHPAAARARSASTTATRRAARSSRRTRATASAPGDAFTAGFLYAWLRGRREQALDYGLAMAALKHSVAGDTLATTVDEVERVVARGERGIRR